MERAVFLFDSKAAADSFFTIASEWPLSCSKLEHRAGNCLLTAAKTAGSFVVRDLHNLEVHGVSAELQKPLDIQFLTAMRVSVGENLLVALWLCKKFEARINAFDLAIARLVQINGALQKIEAVSAKHANAAKKVFPREDSLGYLPMGVYFKVIESEYLSLCHIIDKEITAAVIS